MPHIHVQDEKGVRELERDLSGVDRYALDCEAAGFHRYSDDLCLVQVTTPTATYVVDPGTVDCARVLGGTLQDDAVEVVMHGADYDLRLLARDLDLRVRGLFDTQIAAALLGETSLGLAALLEARLGVKLSKKYQRADWAARPLSDAMLDYAASDTRHLLKLADLLKRDLAECGRTAWAEEEARVLEEVATATPGEDAPDDPVTRVKGARDLPTRQLALLREALRWRDEVARARDRAPFRVVGERPLIEAALDPPGDAGGLGKIAGFPGSLAQAEGAALLDRLHAVAAHPEERLAPYPRPKDRGPGRPPPEVEERIAALKALRNARADEVGIARGTLLPNATLEAIARVCPGDRNELAAVPGLRRWQAELLGADIMETLARRG